MHFFPLRFALGPVRVFAWGFVCLLPFCWVGKFMQGQQPAAQHRSLSVWVFLLGEGMVVGWLGGGFDLSRI